MLMLQSIAPAINLKNSTKKTTLEVFFVLPTWPVSPSGIYGTLLLPLMLLTTTTTKKHFVYINEQIILVTKSEKFVSEAFDRIAQSSSAIKVSSRCHVNANCLIT